MVATYKSLRRLIVAVALTFLVLLLVYRDSKQDTVERHSISAYYHNQGQLFGLVPVRDLFVGSFSAVALMLFAYKGYRWWESRLLNTAGAGLLVVVTCPMEWAQPAVVAEDVAQSLGQCRERTEFIADATIPDPAKERVRHLRTEIEKSKEEAKVLVTEVGNTAPQDDWPKTRTGWAHYIGAFMFFIGIAWVCWFHAEDTLELLPEGYAKWPYKLLYGLTSILMALVPVLATYLYWRHYQSAVFWVELSGVAVFILYWSVKSWELSHVQLPKVEAHAAGEHIKGA